MRVSSGTVSTLNKKIYVQIETWRNRPIEGIHSYVYLDGIYLKKSWGGEVRSISVLVAIGVNSDGNRDILGAMEGAKEDKENWKSFLRHLKERGLKGVKLIISDKCLGLVDVIGDFYPKAKWQRCVVHFYRNVMGQVPHHRLPEVTAMLIAIHAQEDREEAVKKSKSVVEKLKGMKLHKAAEIVMEGTAETLSFMSFPRAHWKKIRTNNLLERLMREIRRRTRVVGVFPDGEAALMLTCGRLRYIAGTKWGLKRYMNMELLRNGQEVAA